MLFKKRKQEEGSEKAERRNCGKNRGRELGSKKEGGEKGREDVRMGGSEEVKNGRNEEVGK